MESTPPGHAAHPTRERILTATNELLRRHGYNGMSIKQISAASSAPMGSLYHFFPDGKDAIVRESLESSGAVYLQLFQAIAAESPSTADAITNFFDGAAALLEASDFIEICPIGSVAREIASTNDPLRSATHRVFTSWIEAATAMFATSGLPEIDARQLAATFIATLEGGFMLARAARDATPLRDAGVVFRRIVDVMIATARTPSKGVTPRMP